MNRTEHLLDVLQEECAETAQRASKAMRFSLKEIQPGQPLDNAERILEEFNQLVAMIEMLHEEGHLPYVFNREIIEAKKAAFEKHLKYSKEVGTLTEESVVSRT